MDMVHPAHYNSDNCIPKSGTHKVTTVRRYQGKSVEDPWLTCLQPIAMYVVIMTVHSGLIIMDRKTCADFVLATSSVATLIKY